MDPDREALREGLRKYDSWAPSDEWRAVVAAARRDLARLEGEKPKRATIDEMITALANHNGCIASLKHEAQALREAAAVLRAVGEFANDYRNAVTEAQGDEAAAKFLRSLP